MMKTCTKCHVEKSRLEFSKDAHRPDGLRGTCKKCAKAEYSTWFSNNVERMKAVRKARYAKERLEVRKKAVAYCAENKEAIKIRYANYLKENHLRLLHKYGETLRPPSGQLKCCSECNETQRCDAFGKNKGTTDGLRYKCKRCESKQHSRRRIENPDAARAADDRNKQYRLNNPERSRERVRNRRAGRGLTEGKLSIGIGARLFAAQSGRCVYCRIDLTTVTPHMDHILPLALGGPNIDGNVQLLCPTCNLRKGARHPEEFARIFYESLLATSANLEVPC